MVYSVYDLLQAGQFRDRIMVGERFYMPSRLAQGSTQYPVQWVLARSKSSAAKHSANHPPPPSPRLRMPPLCSCIGMLWDDIYVS